MDKSFISTCGYMVQVVDHLFHIPKAEPLLLRHTKNCRYSDVASCCSFMFLNPSPFKHFKRCRLDLNITARNWNWQFSNKNAVDVKSLPCRWTTKSESVASGIYTGGVAKVREPSPDIVRTAREQDSIFWGQRPVPAYQYSVNFCPIFHSGPPCETFLKDPQNPNTKFLSVP